VIAIVIVVGVVLKLMSIEQTAVFDLWFDGLLSEVDHRGVSKRRSRLITLKRR